MRSRCSTCNRAKPHLAQIRAVGADAIELTGDVSDEAFVAQAVDAVRNRWGRADVLVNNAGISFIAPAETVDAKAFLRVLQVNLLAPFLLAKAFGAIMLEQHSGSIVNVASIAGLVGVGDRSAYNASKHGLIGLTRTLAAEWGGRGVRVNAVCPGWVKTEMDVADQAGGGYNDADIEGVNPMGRFAAPCGHCQRHSVPRRSGEKRLRQRSLARCRWRMDRGWKLAKPAHAKALKHRTSAEQIPPSTSRVKRRPYTS